MEDRAVMESEIAGLEMELAELRCRGAELEQARKIAAGRRSLVERHLARSDERERYKRQRTELIGMIESLLERPISADRNNLIGSELRTELEVAERAIGKAREDVVRVQSIVGAAEQALRLLEGDQAMCPTCMRPLAHHERDSAIAAHNTHQSDAAAKVARLQEAHKTEEIRSQTIARLLAQLEALSFPSVDTDEDANILNSFCC